MCKFKLNSQDPDVGEALSPIHTKFNYHDALCIHELYGVQAACRVDEHVNI